MVRILTMAALGAISLATFAAPVVDDDDDGMTKEEFMKLPIETRRKMFADYQAKHFGRIVRKEGSDKGCFKFVSAQKSIPLGEIERPIREISKVMRINYALVEGDHVTVENAKAALTKNNAQAAVFIVADEKLPMRLLVAPEEGWAIVNVSKLNEGNPTHEVLVKRLCKETSRAFAYVAGAANGGRAAAVMSPVASLGDLDDLPGDLLPRELFPRLNKQLERFGITPYVQTSYRRACEQGWAPKPSNEQEQKIWDAVHRIPDKPITIKYDKDKDKPTSKASPVVGAKTEAKTEK